MKVEFVKFIKYLVCVFLNMKEIVYFYYMDFIVNFRINVNIYLVVILVREMIFMIMGLNIGIMVINIIVLLV